jgi:F-type H+-transporting ATPase subunit b
MTTLPLGFAEDSIQLVPDGTMLLHILIILVMVYLLNATLFKPINSILAAREQRTKGRLSEAEEILRNVSEKLSAYTAELRQARAEAYTHAENERRAALQERQQKLNELRAEFEQSVAKEKEVIRRQADEARQSLSDESHLIAREIGARLLSRPLTGADMN